MDNITHTIAGIALAHAGLKRYGESTYPAWLLILGANGPDIDVFAGFSANGARYLEVHRGATHSFLGAPFVAITVAAIIWLFHRKWRPKVHNDQPYPWLSSFLLALAGVLSHLLMDVVTPYGTRLLWPFSSTRFSFDIFPVVDLWVLPLLLVVILSPFFFRLISEEIGARKTSFRPAAIAVLTILVLFGCVRLVLHQRVLAVLDSFVYKGREAVRFSAYPDSGSPFLWHAVMDTGDTLEEGDVHVFQEFDPTQTRTFYPPEPSPAIDAARRTEVVQAFLDFAVYPYTYMERREDGYEVIFRDLRYEYGVLGLRKGAVARVYLDQNMNVLKQQFSFRDSDAVR
jgi:inner membrane protein